jgi:hypothetical protein
MDTTHEDLLINRVVDRCESPADWRALELLGQTDPSLWPRLQATLRQDAELRAAVEPALAAADAVDLPRSLPRRRTAALAGLAGWLCAAAVTLAWLTGVGSPIVPAPASTSAGVDLADVPDLADANAVGELPPVLLRAQPTEDGTGMRVLQMRRILEESVVKQVFEVDTDESGDARPVPVELSRIATPTDF